MKRELVRKNVYMSKALGDWYEEKAVAMGVSQSALMVMALQRFYEQDKALEASGQLPELIEALKMLQKGQE